MRICQRCVMNNQADESIEFDANGYCNYCSSALEVKEKVYFPNEDGKTKLKELIKKLKNEGKGKKYDCLMGISGGLDSSYLAYLGAVKWGLRIAAVHIDDGYDTEISSQNIKILCDKANIDLITIKPDTKQYNELTKAYMKAGVPNLAIPQDNILFAYLYGFAKKNHIKYFLSGGNFALECILQKGNTWDTYDLRNLKYINKHFGTSKINKLKLISNYGRTFDRWFYKIETIRPLNFIEYNKDKAFKELKEFCGFEYYGRKHLENYLTAFVQLYWFPIKFRVDKRTSHLSSMIISNQMTREQAINELNMLIYEEKYMNKVKNIICRNMNISIDEIEEMVHSPGKQHNEYPVDNMYKWLLNLRKKLKK